MLTSREIRMLLDSLRAQSITLTIENGAVSTHIAKASGYSANTEVSALQAKLSIMLEVASREGR